jgi:mannose/fructose/N-acetylgalactosamine-specific phosphotransferase system component IIC
VENILIGFLGSFLVLDTTVVLQSLISQPVFACTILGWILGDVSLGLQIGVYLQILWLSIIPVGAAEVPESNTAAIVATVLIFRFGQSSLHFNSVFIFAVLFSLFVSYLGGRLVVLYRKRNVRLLHRTISGLKKGNVYTLDLINFEALLVHFALMFMLITISLIVGDLLFSYSAYIPLTWEVYFKYGLTGILGVGTGLALTIYKERNCRILIAVGIIVATIIIYFVK